MASDNGAAPLSWCEALEAEFLALYGAPPLDGPPAGDPDQRLRAVHAKIHERGPSAVCLSGGGIRSATFALGVLQGLAHVGLLRNIDYLSTVSGGGYTGGWLTAWLHREGKPGRDEIMRELDPAQAAQVGAIDEETPVDRVRRTCRYLAPQGGAASADVWTLVMTMARNLLLNWFVILPLIAAALLIPHIYYALVFAFEVETPLAAACTWQQQGPAAQWFLALSIAGFLIPSGYIVLNFAGRGGQWSQGRFLSLFLLPAVVACVSFTLFWSATPCDIQLGPTVFLAGVVPAAGWLVIGGARQGMRGIALAAGALVVSIGTLWLASHQLAPNLEQRNLLRGAGTAILLIGLGAAAKRMWRHDPGSDGSSYRMRVGPRTIFAALVAGYILGAGVYWMASFGFGFGVELREFYAAFAVPMLLGIGLLQMTVFVGLASDELDDSSLEWWSRCAAWLAIAAVAWAAAGFLVFYMADLIEAGLRAVTRFLSMDHASGSALLAVLVPLVSSLAGLAARNSGTNASGKPSTFSQVLQAVALPLVIFMLLSSVAWANLRIMERMEYHTFEAAPCTPARAPAQPERGNPCHPGGAGLGEVLRLFGGLIVFGLLVSRLVPINRFSLHGMYRQRLIRTFLGASRRDRRPNAFTGFDANDDLRVHDLADVRPLHVINTTLNAVSTTHVGRHETKAESFTFSPLHTGNRFVGYRPASHYGSDGTGPGTGISLGMALAISGAAASSAMGMYSSKARAFLLTLANARLGLWFGNPGSAKTWRRSEPPLGIEPLARELLGLTTDHNPYVYLSDGGHYENLALWEMVARRCRYIIVSDGGCDPAYAFTDLSNAVRRIRLDLGIPIVFPPLQQSREGQGTRNVHGAIGTIKYSAVDGPGAPDGTIVYLKATLSGDEPVDVRNFAATDPLFPHDSTANQFFDEARFESYRMLGYHTVLSVTSGQAGIDSAEALSAIAAKTLTASAS